MQREYDKNTLLALERSPTGITPELLRKVAELGWLGVVIPEAYGGEGRSLTDAAVLFEELGRGPVPGPLFASAVLGALTVQHGGTEAQKRRYYRRWQGAKRYSSRGGNRSPTMAGAQNSCTCTPAWSTATMC